MKLRYRHVIFADILLTFISVVLAAMLRFGTLYPEMTHLSRVLPFMVAAMGIRPLIFGLAGVYRRLWRYATHRDFGLLVGAVLAGSLVLFAFTMFVLVPLWGDSFPRSAILFEGMISLVLLPGLRFVLKETERYDEDIDWVKAGVSAQRRVLIVGAGDSGIQTCIQIQQNPHLGLRAVAFLDDDPRKIGRETHGLPVYGPLIKIADVVREKSIDEVLLAVPGAPQQTVMNIEALCREIPVAFRTIPYFGQFLDGGAGSMNGPASTLKVPMSMPDITAQEIEEVVRVMQSRNLSIGMRTVEFERLVADVARADHAVAVTNGTSALHLCMIASGVGPGDEVITSPFSFVASANCILFEKATPVFVDIDPVTLNMDPGKVEAAITERTKAIIAVHIFGQPADMDPIMAVAKKHKLVVIEDACEAIGAEDKGRRVGAIGRAGTFAFYPNKQMTTGEGAALVTNDGEWAHLFRSLRNQGRDKFDGWLDHSRLGYNYRMSELNAAVGVVQLKRLDDILGKRGSVADVYTRALSSIEEVEPLQISPFTTRMSWFVYVVRLRDGISRYEVITAMEKLGIPARPYFAPIHLQPFYRKMFGFEPGMFPVSEAAGESTVALPFHTNMKAEEIDVVCRALKDVISEMRKETDR
jgi:perosamine synthetase